MDHEKIPQGTSCELCGMVATESHRDEHGAIHYYCEHHAPNNNHSDHSHEHHEHDAPKGPKSVDTHEGHSANQFKSKFWITLILSIPIVAYSETIQELLGYQLPTFPGSDWIAPVLGTAVFVYGGLVFLTSAWHELRAKKPGMMTLIAVAIIAAYGYSLATTFFVAGVEFYWELASLITVMLFGHWMEMRAVGQTQGALSALAKLLPDTATKLADGQHKETPVSDLEEGDMVLVKPGGKIPTDGVIVEGTSDADESLITGESKPIPKTVDGEVIGGSVNGQGALTIKVTKVGEETALAGIVRLVTEAQRSKSKTQLLADRAALYLTIVGLTAGSATLVTWLLLADANFAFERAVTVLVITCPHALGLAIPLVATISTTLGAKQGLLIRKRTALEQARNVDVILFDKTGTLTEGKQQVTQVLADNTQEVLSLAAAVERGSEHSLARAITEYAREENAELPKASSVQAIPGHGVKGTVDNKQITVANARYLENASLNIPENIKTSASKAQKDGKTIAYVVIDGVVAGLIVLADTVRPSSKKTVARLHKMGVEVAMLTGDTELVAKYIANQLQISRYFAEVRPEDKVAKVKQLQAENKRVAMVGDGINDAPALTQADVGIAIGAGTDVAIESAGIVLTQNDPMAVVKTIALARATYSKMIQNLWWAAGYNILAIPLAAGVLAGVGFSMPPAIGALLMSASTVVVAFNAQLLKRTNLTG